MSSVYAVLTGSPCACERAVLARPRGRVSATVSEGFPAVTLPAISQLLSIQPEQIVHGASDVIWVDTDESAVMIRVPEELACAEDGHLGYTQLVRLCEIARHELWRTLTPHSSTITNCVVVHLEMTCLQKITTGMLVSIRPTLASLGTKSFTISMRFMDEDANAELVTAVIKLVALDADGNPAPVRGA